MTTGAVITCLDIETAPLVVYTWSLKDIKYLPLEMVIDDWSLLAFAATRVEGEEIVYQDNRTQSDPRDDFELCKALWKVLDESDIIVGHNVKAFDLKKINARFITYHLHPPSPYRIIDTLLEARRLAAFSSNKLEWLAAALTSEPKSKHHEFPGFSLWSECLRGNQSAWAELEKYNTQDVIATEQLYLKLRPWMTGHPHVGIYQDSPDHCPKCGSDEVQHRGYAMTQAGRYPRMRCNDCYGWSRGRKKAA